MSDSVWDVSYTSEVTYNNASVGGSLTSLSGTKIILPTTCCDLWYRKCHKSTHKMLVKIEHFCQMMSGCTTPIIFVCCVKQFSICLTLYGCKLEHIWMHIQWRLFLCISPSQLLMLHHLNCSEDHWNNLFIMAKLHSFFLTLVFKWNGWNFPAQIFLVSCWRC